MESSIYRYILQHTKRDQVLLVLLTAVSMPFVYLSLDVPKTIINQAIGGVDIPATVLGVPVSQVGFLLIMCGVFLALVVVNGLFKYVINVYRGVVGEKMLRRFRFDLYRRLLRFPMPHFKRTSSAEIIPMVTSETEPLGGFIGDAFALPAFQGGLLITYLFFIFSQDWLLGLAAIALYPPQMWLIPRLQRRVNLLAKDRVRTVRELADRVGESVAGVAEIHANDTSRFERARVSSLLGRIFDIRFEIYRRKFFIKFLNNFLAQVTPFLFYSIGGYFVIQGELSLGALVAVIAAYKDLAPPWKELLKYYQTKEDIRVKYAQIIEQFQPPLMLGESLQSDNTQTASLGRNLVASNLQYSEDEFAKNISGATFRLDLEQHTAVVGQGGGGKEYVGALVARLLQPSGGRLTIDTVQMAEMPQAVVGRQIAYVGPTSYLFTGTVEDNLLYGLKNAPIANPDADDIDDKTKAYRKAAIAAGTTADDPDGPWVDFSRLGKKDMETLLNEVLDVLKVVELDTDVFEFGMNGRFDPADMPHLADAVLKARQDLSARLADPAMVSLVEPFDRATYNVNMSVADNLRFGTSLSPEWEDASLSTNGQMRGILDSVGLTDDLVDTGRRLAAIMIDLFKDVEPDSELFERFSFISAEDLPDYSALLARTNDLEPDALDESDRERLLALPFTLIVSRHRLGLIDESIQERVVGAREALISELGIVNESVQFFDAQSFSPAMTVQDNILFGTVSHGQAQARERVGELVGQTLRELDLQDDIQRLGLRYHAGTGGSRLSVAQRQRLAIARALVKRPELLVLDQATSGLDPASEERLITQIREYCTERGVLWILDRPALAQRFDQVIVMGGGRVNAQGSWADVAQSVEALQA